MNEWRGVSDKATVKDLAIAVNNLADQKGE